MSKPKPIQLCTRSVEFRAVEAAGADAAGMEADGRTLEGYGAVFNAPTEINSFEGHFIERMAPGAFKKTISERRPVLQFDHGHDARTGSVPIGKIDDLREDDHGLYVKARLFDNHAVEPIRQAIEGGAISGMSFRFKVNRDEWRDNEGNMVRSEDLGRLLYEPGKRGPLERTIREVQLYEVGPVVFPAYEQTSVGVRSVTEDDRAALVAEYQRTMAEPEVEVEERLNKMPHGDVEYADPGYQPDGVKRYPIDTAEHVHAALSYIAKGQDADKYTSEQLASIKAKIDAAATKFGIHVSGDADGDGDEKSASVDGAESREDITPSAENTDAALSGTSGTEGTERAVEAAGKPTEAPEPIRKESKIMTIDELRAKLAETVARLAELGEETRDAELDTETQTEWDGLVEARTETEKKIASIEARMETLGSIAQQPKRVERGSDRGTPAFHKKQENIYDLAELRASAYSGEDFQRRVTDNAFRAIDEAKYSVRGREAAQEKATELLENCDNMSGDLAKRMLATGSPEYTRAFQKAMRYGSTDMLDTDERQALLRTTGALLNTDAQGGFAVPFQLDPTVILTNAGVVNPIRDLADVRQITGKQLQLVTSAGISATRAGEAAAVTDSTLTLAQPAVATNRVQVFVPFSVEADLAWGALNSEITKVLIDAKAREEDSFLTGTGDGTTGTTAPQGLLSGATTTVTAGGVASLSAADIYALQAALDPRWERGSSFLAHKAIYHKIRQFDTAGGAQLWARIGDGRPNELLAYPAAAASAMASTLTTANKVMVYGDFSQFLIVDRIGMNVELVPHVFDATTARPTGQRGVYAMWMNNSKVVVPGAFRVLVTG